METKQKLTKKIIDTHFDVVVVGGGLSGVFAAISAARENKKTLLIEKHSYLGGMATSGLISPFMNYCERNSDTRANTGLFATLLEKMYDMGALATPQSRTFREQLLKLVLDQMVKEAGVKVLFRSFLCGVQTSNNRIEKITIATVSGNVDIYGKYFIDGTGNGDLFAQAGVEFYNRSGPTEYNQPMTTCFNVTDVDWDLFDNDEVNEVYNQHQKEGKIKNPRENVLIFNSPIANLMHFNTTRIIKKDPCDVEDLTEAEFIGRAQTLEMFTFLKENFKAFEKSELIQIAEEIGVRESRRVVGEYMLNEEELLQTIKFEDSIARGTYDIDIHNPDGSGTVIKHIPEHDYYTIPYRCLVPVGCDNLLVAGRAICCTHEAHASVRVMPITSCIGEAAGIAAALALNKNCPCKEVDAKKIQAKLTAYNALY